MGVDKNLGTRITDLRNQYNMTQSELARRLDLKQNTISCYEKGTLEPNLKGLLKLSEIFSVSLDWLIGREKTETHLEKIILHQPNLLFDGIELDNYTREKILLSLQSVWQHIRPIKTNEYPILPE